MIKAMKKLKLWSRKKRKKKTHQLPPPHYPPPNYPPPPPPLPSYHHCFCTCSPSTEPSAPPLPAWLEPQQNYGTFLAPNVEPIPEVTYQTQAHQVPPHEITMEPKSYQQYAVSEPVYGIPINQTEAKRSERSRGLFGCVFSFGAHLFRCLFPCFHIREVA